MSKNNVCGAKTRSGSACQNRPVKGSNRCRMHGGQSPKGKSSPAYKHGLYSKYTSKSMQDILEDFQDSETDFTDPTEEIKLLQAVIASAEMLKKDTQDKQSLEAISKAISSLILSKQRAQQLQIERSRLIPVQEVELFLQWIESVLTRFVDTEQVPVIMEEIRNFKVEDHHVSK